MTFELLNSPKTLDAICKIIDNVTCKINIQTLSNKQLRFIIVCDNRYIPFINKVLSPFI